MTTRSTHPRVIVAGLGNIFLGDDAFGVEVTRTLMNRPIPDDVHVLDIGLRSLYLGYELAETGCDTVVLVDCVQRGGAPGTLYVLEPEQLDDGTNVALEPHAVRPDNVSVVARSLGARAARILIVGCEPAHFDPAAPLSAAVAAAIGPAAQLVCELCA